jgi:hypothetical protein
MSPSISRTVQAIPLATFLVLALLGSPVRGHEHHEEEFEGGSGITDEPIVRIEPHFHDRG